MIKFLISPLAIRAYKYGKATFQDMVSIYKLPDPTGKPLLQKDSVDMHQGDVEFNDIKAVDSLDNFGHANDDIFLQ